jgi:ABC-type ATPase with predicted acetyltransferase domain
MTELDLNITSAEPETNYTNDNNLLLSVIDNIKVYEEQRIKNNNKHKHLTFTIAHMSTNKTNSTVTHQRSNKIYYQPTTSQ